MENFYKEPHPFVTTCDFHDQSWLSDLLWMYRPDLGRDVCNHISSLLVVRYNSDMNKKKFVGVKCGAGSLIECSTLCPYFKTKFKGCKIDS